jgi:DNA-binding MarR family transcriptional regulator
MHLFRYILIDVDGLELYQLGRRLTKVGEAALKGAGEARLPAGIALILLDVVEHPGSPIRDIAARTGFPQGHVSSSVARLRERGVVETATDSADGRRTLVKVTADFARKVARHRAAPVNEALAEETGIDSPQEVAEIVATLESLASRLLTKHRKEADSLAG